MGRAVLVVWIPIRRFASQSGLSLRNWCSLENTPHFSSFELTIPVDFIIFSVYLRCILFLVTNWNVMINDDKVSYVVNRWSEFLWVKLENKYQVLCSQSIFILNYPWDWNFLTRFILNSNRFSHSHSCITISNGSLKLILRPLFLFT